MAYRTRTYLAADWTGDRDLIDRLHRWNEVDYWGLSFTDAHDLTQARDTSLPCSIKNSLWKRLERSKTFVLVVGADTDGLTKGGCRYCRNYSAALQRCRHGMRVDHRSFIRYECEYAATHDMRVVVLYNYASVHRDKCPEPLRGKGEHLAAYYWGADNRIHWDYQAIKRAVMG